MSNISCSYAEKSQQMSQYQRSDSKTQYDSPSFIYNVYLFNATSHRG